MNKRKGAGKTGLMQESEKRIHAPMGWIRTAKARQMMVFAGFFLILLAVHAFIKPDFGDDLHYAQEWGKEPLSVFLKNRYEWWSSRVVIEAAMLPVAAAPVWVWRLLNVFMLLLLVFNAADLFAAGGQTGTSRRIQAQFLYFAGLWMVPVLTVCGAGWITTTTNYLWALSLGLIALRPLKHWLCRERCAWWEYLACPLCTLYAANMEQMGAVLCGAYLTCGAYLLIKKRRVSFLYPVLLLLILWMLYFVLSSPGNGWRNQYEVERYFPVFEFLTVGQKLQMGFLETGQYYLAGGERQGCYILALLAGVLCVAALQKLITGRVEGKGRRLGQWCGLLAALVPAAFYWGVGHLGNDLLSRGALPRGGHIVGVLGGNRSLPELGRYSAELVAMQTAVYLILFLCIALSVYLLHGKSEETLLELIVLAAGIASRVIIGFSPTIYVSGERTAIFCSAAFLIVAFRNIQIFWNGSAGWRGKAAVTAYMAALMIGNLYQNRL